MTMSSILSRDAEFWIPEWLDEELKPGIYHSEWRSFLNRKNKAEVSELLSMPLNSLRFGLYSRKTAKFFHRVCHLFEMPPEILFLTIDMFDNNTAAQNNKAWKFVEGDMKMEACLTAMSCIQLATKISCHSKVLAISTIIDWMRLIGLVVDKQTVVRSEIRVLTTIGWALPSVTALTYVEMFLEEMTCMMVGVSRSELLQVCTGVVNVATIHHKEIYRKLHQSFKKREMLTLSEKIRFLSIEGDAIRLAASIICAGTTMYDPSGHLTSSVAEYLSTTTKYRYSELLVLANILVQVILRVNTDFRYIKTTN